MNNGRPPYGSQPGWSQQGMQGYGQQPGYAPQQPQSNQMNPQNQPPMNQPLASQQPYAGYPGYAPQQGYAPTPQQMQQQRYPQQQTPYQQSSPQSYPPQGQGYGQQQRYGQQQAYQQPYPQPASQRYWPQQQPYQQQQMQQQNYIGYQPPKTNKSASPETIALAIIGGVLPILFILSLVLPGAGALKWIFIAMTLAMIAYIWVRPVVKGNLRLILSLVGGALSIVALVSALTASSPADSKNNSMQQASQQQSNISLSGQNSSNTGTAANGGSIPGWSYTDMPANPPNPPTPTPTSHTVSAAQRQLESFFYFWSANSYDNMISLTLPSWQKGLASPQAELFGILVNRTPVAYQITKVSGTDNDTSRQITVLVEISKNNNSNKTELYSYQVLMTREDGVWYVDPRSLKSNEKESTPAPTNSMPTQPPDITSHPDLVLYYNPDGGTLYHVDPNCASAAKSYLPFKGSFTWSQINSGDYAKLKYCNTCNAPLRQQ